MGMPSAPVSNGTDTAGLIWDAIKRRHAEL